MIIIQESCSGVKHNHNSTQSKSDKMEFVLTQVCFFFILYHLSGNTAIFPHCCINGIMKVPSVIHVHKRADLGLTRDPFLICIANSFLKNRQNAICRMIMDKKGNFLFVITMRNNQLAFSDFISQPFLPLFEYTEQEAGARSSAWNPIKLFLF